MRCPHCLVTIFAQPWNLSMGEDIYFRLHRPIMVPAIVQAVAYGVAWNIEARGESPDHSIAITRRIHG